MSGRINTCARTPETTVGRSSAWCPVSSRCSFRLPPAFSYVHIIYYYVVVRPTSLPSFPAGEKIKKNQEKTTRVITEPKTQLGSAHIERCGTVYVLDTISTVQDYRMNNNDNSWQREQLISSVRCVKKGGTRL